MVVCLSGSGVLHAGKPNGNDEKRNKIALLNILY